MKKILYLLTFVITLGLPSNLFANEKTYNDAEFELVCRVVSAEARGECEDGQKAVVEVIKNRSELWDMTLTEVVTTKNQFAKPYKGEIPQSVKNAVVDVLYNDESVLDNEPVTYFHSGDKPYWTKDKTFVTQIENHYFYK